jgi:hypothetical protein
MAYAEITTRTTDDLNASADINQLMENINIARKERIDDILLKIEMLEVVSALCDPLNISSKFMIADGSTIPSDSEAYIIHNTGGTILSGTYFERTYTGKGLTVLPDIRGYHPRYMAKGSTADADRANRRQGVTGTVDTTSGTIIYLPKYYINIISEAVTNSRTVIIGVLNSTIFTDPTIYGTVQSVNTSLNYVVLTSITGTFTAGSASLVVKGDVIGSFQNDQMQRITGSMGKTGEAGTIFTGTCSGAIVRGTNTNNNVYFNGTSGSRYLINFDSSKSTGARAGAETYGKNIALLPLVRIYL